MTILAWALLFSVLGTLLAGVVGLFLGRRAHIASHCILALSAILGAIVSIVIAIGDGSSLILPLALYPNSGGAITWPLFYGMIFGLDGFSAIFYCLVSVITVFVSIYAVPYLEKHESIYNLNYVNALTAVCIFGMQGVILSTNIIGFMAFWEIMSLTAFYLILSDGTKSSHKAGFLYLSITQLGAGAVMAGLFLLSGGALLSDFSVLATVTSNMSPTTMSVALALILFGFGSQAGLVPLHGWLPGAQTRLPGHTSALMSGVMLSIAVYGFLRVLLFMLPGVPMWFVMAVLGLGASSAAAGILYSLLERNLNRLLAYLSIANSGLTFTMIGVALLAGQERSNDLTESALYAALLLVAAHALLQAGLALASGIITSIVHSPSLEAMGGLAKRLPGFSMAVFCLALTAATLPPFAPFVSEWILVQAIVSALNGATLVFSATMVIILSVIGFVAGLALFASIKMYAMVFLAQPRSEAAEAALDPVPGLMMPVVSLAALGLLLGIFSPYVLNQIGAEALVPTGSAVSGIAIDGGVLEPVTLSMTLVGILIVLMCFRYFLSDARQERIADTWGGGQPITPRMEYTATAFSAPIRFFFRFFTRTKKATVVTPVTPSNPWVTRQSLSLLVNKLWHNKLYTPVGKGVMRLASWAGRLHNGSVQFYICLVLLTLFVSLILAL